MYPLAGAILLLLVHFGAADGLLLVHFGAADGQTDDSYTLNLIDLKRYPKAVCLDSTPGAFYTRTGTQKDKYLLHLQGGAWCGKQNDCAGRALTALGTSSEAFWPRQVSCPPGGTGTPMVCSFDGGNGGIFSSNATINPLMSTWNHAFAVYCDGGSFSGNVTPPFSYNNTSYYLRGSYILEAIIGTLLTDFGASSATDFVLNGNSAGGLAVYLAADRVSAQLHASNPTLRVTALPDSGFFMDVNSYLGTRNLLESFQQIYSFHRSVVNAGCLAAQSPATAWQCFYPQYALPYIQTPLFVAQTFGDSWQQGPVMRLPCPLHECWTNESMWSGGVQTYVAGFRQQMLHFLLPVLNSSGHHGGFIAGCDEHGIAGYDGAWSKWAVANQSMAETFAAWYGGDAVLPHSLVEGEWPLPWALPNPTCKYYQS